MFNRVFGLMVSGGRLLLRINMATHESWDSALKTAGFSGIDQILSGNIILTTAKERIPATNGFHPPTDEILLACRDAPTSLHAAVSGALEDKGWMPRSMSISSIASIYQVSSKQAMLLVDTEGPFLAQLKKEELEGLAHLTEGTSAIAWVTCGSLLAGDRPEYGMTAGFARTIWKEKRSLDLVTLDFDVETTPEQRVVALLVDIAERQRRTGRNGETEYCLQNGVPISHA